MIADGFDLDPMGRRSGEQITGAEIGRLAPSSAPLQAQSKQVQVAIARTSDEMRACRASGEVAVMRPAAERRVEERPAAAAPAVPCAP